MAELGNYFVSFVSLVGKERGKESSRVIILNHTKNFPVLNSRVLSSCLKITSWGMLPKCRADLFEGENTWHSRWRVERSACLRSLVLLGLFFESRECKLWWLWNVACGESPLFTVGWAAPCSHPACWVIRICCRCAGLHWGLGFTSSTGSFAGRKDFWKAFKISWNLWLNSPSCCCRFSRVRGRPTGARLQLHLGKAYVDSSPCLVCIFIRQDSLKDKNMHKSPRFLYPQQGNWRGKQLPDEVLDNIWCVPWSCLVLVPGTGGCFWRSRGSRAALLLNKHWHRLVQCLAILNAIALVP